MSWSVTANAARDEIDEAIENAAPPYEMGEGPAAQLEAAKSYAKDLVHDVARDGSHVQVSMAGHYAVDGDGHSSMSVSVSESAPPQP